MALKLPPELIGEILELNRDDTSAILSFSLVSGCYLKPCRRYLFSTIDLANDDTQYVANKFFLLFREIQRDPTLANHTTCLKLNLGYGYSRRKHDGLSLSRDTRLPLFLQAFHHLRELELCNQSFTADHQYLREVKPALARLMALPSLETVTLRYLVGFPWLSEALRLKHLVFDYVKIPHNSVQAAPVARSSPPTLQSLSFLDSPDQVIHAITLLHRDTGILSSLKKLIFRDRDLYDGTFIPLLESLNGTTDLHELVWHVYTGHSSENIFVQPALSRLRHLGLGLFSLAKGVEGGGTLKKLPNTIAQLPTPSSIETISLTVKLCHGIQSTICTIEPYDFTLIDQNLQSPTLFPSFTSLRWQFVSGSWYGESFILNEEALPQLRALVESKLPNLFQKKVCSVEIIL